MYEVPQRLSGRLWIMPCPDGAMLERSLDHYKRAGARRIVSMLGDDEATRLGVADEAALCRARGIGFVQHPIQDFGLPQVSGFDALVQQIQGWLAGGQGVAVHCRAGIGRSGMVTAAVLVAQGQTAAQAMAAVAQARGNAIPDTVEQGSFVTRFATRFSE